MRKTTLLLTFLITTLACPCAFAWSEKDVVWESAFVAATIAESKQNLAGASACSVSTASGQLSGLSADLGCLNTAAITNLVIHAGISSLLPSKYRRMFQQGSVGFDLSQSEPVTRVAVSLEF